mmetsp:Transcript_36925/g.80444  ORF Transcript_36925/g.80444 Transcript_36925/m.80444 type:complete len:455 (-) Transcript_36925:380-1744(-)
MQALAQQQPALAALPLVDDGAPPLVVLLLQRPPGLRDDEVVERREHLGALRLEAVAREPEAVLALLQPLRVPLQEPLQAGGALQAGAHEGDDDLHRQVGAVVQVEVLLHGSVPARLNHQMRLHPLLVQLHPLGDDVLVAAHVAEVLPPARGNELLQPGVGDAVGDDGGARVLRQRHRRQQRDQPVLVDLQPGAVHHAAAVHVGVEHHPQVRPSAPHRRHRHRHRLRVLGVGHVVGEIPVGVQELAPGGVRAQRLQHHGGEEPAAAVARIHHHLQSLEGGAVVLRVVHPLLDELPQRGGVHRQKVHGGAERHVPHQKPRGPVLVRVGRRRLEDEGNVGLLEPPLGGEELDSVAVPGEVRGGAHHAAVVLVTLADGGHEAGGRGGQPHVHRRDALGGQARQDRRDDRLSRQAGVPSHGYLHPSATLTILNYPLCEPTSYEERLGRRDGYRFSLDTI